MSEQGGSAGRRPRRWNARWRRRGWEPRWRRPRRRPGDDRGYSVVEAAITLPALVFLCMIVVQFALIWHGRNVVQAAARDGLEAARAYQSPAGAGQTAASSYLAEVAPKLVQSPSISVNRSATTVTVTIRATVLKVVPVGSFAVTETASGPVERFVTAGSFGSFDGVTAPTGRSGTGRSGTGIWL